MTDTESEEICRVMRQTIVDMCGDGDAPDRRSPNTIYMEVIFSQGRTVQPADVQEVNDFIDGVVDAGLQNVDIYRVSLSDVVVVPGTRRASFDRGPDQFQGSQQSIHAFVKFDNMSLSVSNLSMIRSRIKSDAETMDVTIGRGLDSIRVVDEAVVEATAPGLVRPGMGRQQT